MTYANIKLKTHKARDAQGNQIDQEPMIFDFIKPMIEQLALKYPQWEFVENGARTQWPLGGGNFQAADEFLVMEKREELGRIRVDHWCRAGKRFWVDNFRIDAQRERGSGFKTKHMTNAIKYVNKYFGAKDHSELMATAEYKALEVCRQVTGNLHSDVRLGWNRLDDLAEQFVREKHWEEFSAWVKGNTKYTTVVDEYPEQYLHYSEARKISSLINDGKAWLVHIVNSDYIVKVGDAVALWESDTLPNIVRRNLGMLKLVKDRELISNVGLRVDEATYYVVGENNE